MRLRQEAQAVLWRTRSVKRWGSLMSESAHHRRALICRYIVEHCRSGTAPALFADTTVTA